MPWIIVLLLAAANTVVGSAPASLNAFSWQSATRALRSTAQRQ